MDRFDRVFWRRWWSLAKPYWVSEQKREGFYLLAILILLTLFSIGMNAELSFVSRDLTNALTARDYLAFRRNLVFMIGAFVISIPMTAFYPWVSARLRILWREWMTHRFVNLEFSNRAYYRIAQNGVVDNPDQRISEDIEQFTAGALGYVDSFATSIVRGFVFFVILWSISPMLAVIAVGYSGIGTIISLRVSRPLIPINFDQQRYEADFRFALVHVRDNVESIAMLGGERREALGLFDRFSRLVSNFNLLILWKRRLAYVTESYDHVITLLPYLVLASAYFARKLELGQLFQATSAFLTVKSSLSLVVQFLQSFTAYAAVVNRLATFQEHCERVEDSDPRAGTPAPHIGEMIEATDSGRLALDSVTLRTPDHRQTLVRDLSFEAQNRGGLLLRGPSGSGKTSILRAIGGLWRSGRGRIDRPEPGESMFLPQKPYMMLGTLRDQLCYPRGAMSDDEELRAALAAVNLADVPERLGGFDLEQNWTQVLSPGEQQRLSFARLLTNKPSWVFLDEPTSALDRANETLLYELLVGLGVAYVSVSHDESVAKYHQQIIEMDGSGGWMQTSPQERAAG